MLNIGVDSYCSVSEADEYISKHFVSTSIEVEIWGALSDTDKAVYLRDSATSLNGINYKGRKKIRGQLLAFPRISSMVPGVIRVPIVYNQAADMTLISGFGSSDGGLAMAKEAQIENALSHAVLDPQVVRDTRVRVLSGISSERAGSISRSYNDMTSNPKSNLMLKGIYNPDKIEAKLKCWLSTSAFSI